MLCVDNKLNVKAKEKIIIQLEDFYLSFFSFQTVC